VDIQECKASVFEMGN